uniref:NADH-ubiquinone oxidoreductase chain 6 n=1 Tax=Risoba prominens TaxID=1485277 RepID=A0A0E3DAV6_9NEOP|nr:NADH dehydrogenase subunit 6 [Risoba prominens]AHW51563.1 NADH dehydrogenase subunit 6 [Risoba prominens]UNP54401.1 NADH dehydrogenase subunit 6 [Risoba prominens]
MMKIFLSTMLIMISMIMLFINNPLPMGLMILLQTLLICLISGLMIKTYWFSYILFLTFLGGLLVLFIYVSSIASNELFKSFMFTTILMMILFFSFIVLIQMIFMNNISWMNLYFNSDMNSMLKLNFFFNNDYKISLNKLYNNQTFTLMMMMVIYLFITLVAIVKITNIFYGPLRSIY